MDLARAVLWSMIPDACFVIMIVLLAFCAATIAANVYESWRRRQWEKPRRGVKYDIGMDPSSDAEDYHHE